MQPPGHHARPRRRQERRLGDRSAVIASPSAPPAPPPVCRRLGRPAHLLRIFHTLRQPGRGSRGVENPARARKRILMKASCIPVVGRGFHVNPFQSRWRGVAGWRPRLSRRLAPSVAPVAECVFLLAGPAAPVPRERYQRRAVVQKAASPRDWCLQLRQPGRCMLEVTCGTLSHASVVCGSPENSPVSFC